MIDLKKIKVELIFLQQSIKNHKVFCPEINKSIQLIKDSCDQKNIELVNESISNLEIKLQNFLKEIEISEKPNFCISKIIIPIMIFKNSNINMICEIKKYCEKK